MVLDSIVYRISVRSGKNPNRISDKILILVVALGEYFTTFYPFYSPLFQYDKHKYLWHRRWRANSREPFTPRKHFLFAKNCSCFTIFCSCFTIFKRTRKDKQNIYIVLIKVQVACDKYPAIIFYRISETAGYLQLTDNRIPVSVSGTSLYPH